MDSEDFMVMRESSCRAITDLKSEPELEVQMTRSQKQQSEPGFHDSKLSSESLEELIRDDLNWRRAWFSSSKQHREGAKKKEKKKSSASRWVSLGIVFYLWVSFSLI